MTGEEAQSCYWAEDGGQRFLVPGCMAAANGQDCTCTNRSHEPMQTLQQIRELLDENPHDPTEEIDDLVRMINQIDGLVSRIFPSKWSE